MTSRTDKHCLGSCQVKSALREIVETKAWITDLRMEGEGQEEFGDTFSFYQQTSGSHLLLVTYPLYAINQTFHFQVSKLLKPPFLKYEI